jgi:hypothetical protein
VSLALLIGSALLIESFLRVRGSSAGFEVDDTASVSFQVPASRYPEPLWPGNSCLACSSARDPFPGCGRRRSPRTSPSVACGVDRR